MTAARLWFGTVLAFTATGGVTDLLFGQLLYRISTNYVYVIAEFVSRGARAGLLAGSLVAAAAIVGPRRLPPGGFVAKCLAGATGFVMVAGLLTGLSGYMASRAGLLQSAAGFPWQVGNPNRVAFCLGLEYGVAGSYWIALAAACIFIWRQRLKPCVQRTIP